MKLVDIYPYFLRNIPTPSLAPTSRQNRAKSFAPCCLYGLHFDPEDGSSTFIRNVGELLSDYMAENSRHQYSS